MSDKATITFEQLYNICFVRWENLCHDCENKLDEECTPENCIEWKNLGGK